MTPKELQQWRISLPNKDGQKGVTKAEAARLLNHTPPTTYADWESGRRRIPAMLPLACYAVSKGWSVNTKWLNNQ